MVPEEKNAFQSLMEGTDIWGYETQQKQTANYFSYQKDQGQ